MPTITNLQTYRRARLQARSKAITFCQSGFHKWKPVPEQRFDVRQGKLITTERCQHCNKERTRLS